MKSVEQSDTARINSIACIYALLTSYRVYLCASIILFALSGCLLGRTMVNRRNGDAGEMGTEPDYALPL